MDFSGYLGCLIVLKGSHLWRKVSELCVEAQLPADEGGLGSSVIFIDGGNVFDPYLIADLSRQYNAPIGQVLQGVKVARAFTCHQLVSLICEKLPIALKFYNSRLAVVSDIFSLFNEVEAEEARGMFNHVTWFLSELAKKENVMVITACMRPASDLTLESYLTSRADITLDIAEGTPQVTLESYVR